MGFPGDEAVRFADAVRSRTTKVESFVNEMVNVHHAQATVARDKDMIHGKIAESVGVDAFNQTVRKKLVAYFVHSVKQVVLNHRHDTLDQQQHPVYSSIMPMLL